jgi:hypothetical protein
MKLVFLLALPLLALGCTEKVSFDTAEDARATAKANATYVVQSFRRENPRFSAYDIMARGDSSITNTCPQGDGWASVDLIPTDGGEAVKLKCSTVSLSIGCLLEEDFRKRDYAREDGSCNAEIPFPLPKVVK